LCCNPCNNIKGKTLFQTIEEARRFIHETLWSKPRQRWIDHQPIAFGGLPPAIVGTRDASFSLPDWVDAQTWADFLEMRKKMKASPTLKAMALLIGVLDKLRADGNDPKAVLERSIERGWKGVFELPAKGNSNGVANFKIDPRRAHEEGASHGRDWVNVAEPADDNRKQTV